MRIGSLIFAPLVTLFSSAAADLAPFVNDPGYEQGQYGAYANQTFKTSPIIAPRVNIIKSSERCHAEGNYVFLAPRGHKVPREYGRGPMILDDDGTLIWAYPEFEPDQVYNLAVQQWKGESYLTFWAGNNKVRGHGEGKYYIYDNSYKLVKKFDAGRGLLGDLHEFLITDHGTALMTIYKIVPADLTARDGPRDGWIYNCLFQEKDLETDEVLFEWSAIEHYGISDSFHILMDDVGRTPETAWDFFHINSIAKDPKGNYLISSRYTHSVTYIDGKTGKIIWILGGKRNDFKDLNEDGLTISFASQHDARWDDDTYTTVTLFDNAADWNREYAKYSRGMRIKLDTEASPMTADLIGEYIHPLKFLAASQASTRLVPATGNILLGYGITPRWTEFDADTGEVLCDVSWNPSIPYNSGNAQSYRTLKFPWVGKPTTQPSVSVEQASKSLTVYVSWNGATEVKRWILQDMSGSSPRLLREVSKQGFETKIIVNCDDAGKIPLAMRIIALDKTGNTLAKTRTFGTQPWMHGLSPFMVGLIGGVLAVMFFLPCCIGLLRRLLRIRAARRNRQYQPVMNEDEDEFRESDSDITLTSRNADSTLYDTGIRDSDDDDSGKGMELPPPRTFETI